MSTPISRYRGFLASPRLKIAAILCIAVGLAAVSALLTFAQGVLSRPLPFPEQDRLVRVWVEEPTVVSQDAVAGPLIVPGPGPLLPAAAAMKMPASRAARKAWESASVQGSLDGPPPTE